MEKVYLGLGSNVGNCAEIIRAAFVELSAFLADARLSRLWSSKALYFEDQPDFINAVAGGDCELPPRMLLTALNRIELIFGRDRPRERKKGPRSLDIDILLYGSLILTEPELIIPHLGLKERQFALLPLLDLDPDLKDQVSGEPYKLICQALPRQGIYLLE